MKSDIYTGKVQGMICPQCEDEIAARLLHTRGILACDASYRRNTVTAEYDSRLITVPEIEKILTETGYPAGNGSSGRRADFVAFGAVAVLYFLIPLVTGLVKLPMTQSGSGFASLFLVGVLTGVHCIGMCGGIMLSQSDAFLYNGGRILSYTILGGIFGAIGKILGYDEQMKSMLFTVCGLLVVLVGLKMWGVPFLRQLSPEPAKPCRFKGKALIVGLLTGLMPCGVLSTMWMLAASSGSWLDGSVSMLAFGLGTCVFMLIFGLSGALIPKRYNKYILKASTVLIVALGLILMTKGIRLILV